MADISRLDHVTICTPRVGDTVAFFERVLGLENRPDDRPDLDVAGAWLWLGDRAVVHIVEVAHERGEPRGPFDHVAFVTDDFDRFIATLAEHDVDHTLADQPRSGLRQVFFTEPNGVRVEVAAATRP